MTYFVIYDGNCNLCVTLVKFLETLDKGTLFQYIPMQDEAMLNRFGITSQMCELGMIVINAENPDERWQGSEAAEKIGQLLPMGESFVTAYRAIPGLKWGGDHLYATIRDNRYALFGKRSVPYTSLHPACESDTCNRYFSQ